MLCFTQEFFLLLNENCGLKNIFFSIRIILMLWIDLKFAYGASIMLGQYIICEYIITFSISAKLLLYFILYYIFAIL